MKRQRQTEGEPGAPTPTPTNAAASAAASKKPKHPRGGGGGGDGGEGAALPPEGAVVGEANSHPDNVQPSGNLFLLPRGALERVHAARTDGMGAFHTLPDEASAWR